MKENKQTFIKKCFFWYIVELTMFCKVLSQEKYYFIKIKKESVLLGSADFYWTLHPVALPPLLSLWTFHNSTRKVFMEENT